MIEDKLREQTVKLVEASQVLVSRGTKGRGEKKRAIMGLKSPT